MTRRQLLCIGHRGAKGHEPENTLVSFRRALELGAQCVELDVYTVEGELVVFHDDRLERTTNGKGLLAEQSFAYLRSLNAGKGERIPTLREVVDAVNRAAGINIELKGRATAGPVAQLIAQMREEGWSDDLILVSSFDREELETLRKLDPEVKIGVLIDDPAPDDAAFASRVQAYSLHPALKHANRSFLEDARARGFRVYVYTVNALSDIRRMEELGVDGVFSDFPERVLDGEHREDNGIGWR